MTGLREVGSVDAASALEQERAAFVTLLEQLSADEWASSTECPAWTVKGIALHVLGDDLSLLSRQRDETPSPVAIAAQAQGWDQLFELLDRFNEAWVGAASFVSVPLLLELLHLSGEWARSWYVSVD